MDKRQTALVVLGAYVLIHFPASFLSVAWAVAVGPVLGGFDWLAFAVAVGALVLSLGMAGLWNGVRSGAAWLPEQGRRFSRAFVVLHVAILVLALHDNLDLDLYLALLLAAGVVFVGVDLWLARALPRLVDAERGAAG